MAAKYVEGDHGTIYRRQIKDQSGTPVDVTDAIDVTLRWVQGNLQERAMTVTDGPNGFVEYVIQASDFNATTPNNGISFELEYTDSAGNRYTTPALDGPYEIRKQLGATAGMTAQQRIAASARAKPTTMARVAPPLGRPALRPQPTAEVAVVVPTTK